MFLSNRMDAAMGRWNVQYSRDSSGSYSFYSKRHVKWQLQGLNLMIFVKILYLLLEKKVIHTFLTVLPIKAQRTITFVSVFFRHTAAPVNTWGIHTGVDSILHIDSRSEILLHINCPVIQDNLGLKKKNIMIIFP